MSFLRVIIEIFRLGLELYLTLHGKASPKDIGELRESIKSMRESKDDSERLAAARRIRANLRKL